jgi:hypothetical protein
MLRLTEAEGYRQESLETKEGWLLDAPFEHTQSHYTTLLWFSTGQVHFPTKEQSKFAVRSRRCPIGLGLSAITWTAVISTLVGIKAHTWRKLKRRLNP